MALGDEHFHCSYSGVNSNLLNSIDNGIKHFALERFEDDCFEFQAENDISSMNDCSFSDFLNSCDRDNIAVFGSASALLLLSQSIYSINCTKEKCSADESVWGADFLARMLVSLSPRQSGVTVMYFSMMMRQNMNFRL
eukprot:TRINITY_DN3193_c0_g1_i2.p2 TRINITY_DN3193_c0_g1~~TRINITY_DN3193_c0_g1_i2.p2  ORF type:complete len:138 (+),score=6.88 TRINITY_DN3193_c0_g1_i2:517-930(+)